MIAFPSNYGPELLHLRARLKIQSGREAAVVKTVPGLLTLSIRSLVEVSVVSKDRVFSMLPGVLSIVKFSVICIF
jgi:hypothetical protein